MEYLNFINGIIGLLTPIVVEVTAKKLTGIKKVLVALIWCLIATLVSLALQNKLNFADVDSMLGTLIIIFSESQIFWRTTWKNVFS
mgnify:FL=1|jgi:hypothetical protein